jgi:hypothetical protein
MMGFLGMVLTEMITGGCCWGWDLGMSSEHAAAVCMQE